ncbi:MAG: NAD-dependent epimerase/dehydratase family protein [Synergistaceae bacterium]|nr:NAD-dependent epimerase/dehydratase family protein [Synergistaceae bacterium]
MAAETMDSAVLTSDIEYLAKLGLWDFFAGKTILITGATGMLGAYLALSAIEVNRTRGCAIRLLLLGRDRRKAASLFGERECEMLIQDVRAPLATDQAVNCVFHAAGPVGPSVFGSDPEEVLSVNIEGTFSLLRYAIRHDCECFALASTHEVYGAADGERDETSPLFPLDSLEPRSCYVLAKQSAENALSCYHKKYGLRALSARLSRLYGPLMNLESGLFVCDFMKDILSCQPVRVRGGMNLLRPLCYVADAAAAMLFAAVFGKGGFAYNVQGRELPSIGEIAGNIARIGCRHAMFDHPETKNLPPHGHWLNTDRLKNLGWKQTVGLSEGMGKTLSFLMREKKKEAAI